jgi:hypothetical protein
MIIKDYTDISRRAIIKSEDGRIAVNVKEFNTETKEAVCYAMIVYDNDTKRPATIGTSLFDGKRKIVTFKCHLLGHKVYDKETGEEIK